MAGLLPNRKQFKWLLIPTGLMYLVMAILIRPEANPDLIGHLMIWLFYGLTIYLFSKSQKSPAIPGNDIEMEKWEPKRWLLLAGTFPLAATAGEILLTGFFEIMALVFWFGGILFGVVVFIKAVRLVFPRRGAEVRGEI
jgi:hypothetical protein